MYGSSDAPRRGQDISSGGMDAIQVNVNDVTVLVSGLDPFTNYIFYVLAVTITPSEPSDNVTVLTNEAGE